jgi:hypothetical protein
MFFSAKISISWSGVYRSYPKSFSVLMLRDIFMSYTPPHEVSRADPSRGRYIKKMFERGKNEIDRAK